MAVWDLADDQPSPWVGSSSKSSWSPIIDPEDDTEIPFKLVANRFKSSSAASDEFIHDPLACPAWRPRGRK